MHGTLRPLALVAVAAALAACGGGDDGLAVGFAAEASQWQLGSADYSDDTAPSELSQTVVALPAPLAGQGLRLAGHNHSDDLFVFTARRIDGLQPGARYRVRWALRMVATVPGGCIGVGGAPGEGVTVKAGAAGRAPARVREGAEWRFNLDKGDQTQGGSESMVLGNLSSSGRDCVAVPPELKPLSGVQPTPLVAAADGSAWAWVGFDSGYEAASELILVDGRLTLEPL
ncbi:hypothetical protein KAK07_21825 [Ideonella sp. 4Y16]|uniref:hypothetical protein n=1 Tax=Ideonella alba TaxID=2824118 RepID=UPI001B386E3B|nr:hypothetical protein [Ideonella alba]MBQ0945996.1 hypothetical protein [Ideonella alba]